MGYTHYWNTNKAFTGNEWSEIKTTFKALQKNAGFKLAGWDGTGRPEINNDLIRFNGIEPDDSETMTFEKEQIDFQFCKTQYRPYDSVVVAHGTGKKHVNSIEV